MSRARFHLLLALVAAALFGAIAWLPFFSEDFTQMLEGSRLASVWQSLGPELEPLRPLQHLPFALYSRCEAPHPAWLRLVAVLAHVGSALLVARLALRLGAQESDARLAGLLFAVFPCVKALVWGAAISSPLRVVFVLGALVAFAERRALLLVACTVLALASHEGAIVLPALFVLFAWILGPRRRLLEPAVLLSIAGVLAHVVYLAFLRPQRHHGLKSLEALPANAVKACFSFAPEPLRELVVEGLRGHTGQSWLFLAIGVFLAWIAVLGLAVLRGRPALRFLVLAIAADLVLPVIGAGFTQRYAYFSGGMAAIALVLWSARWPARVRQYVLGAAFALWSVDTIVDLVEYAHAGRLQARVLAQLREERAAAPAGRLLALIDLPDMAGNERDLPLFNWGAEECVKRAGIPGPWVFWRTRDFATSSDIPRVTRERLRTLTDEGVRALEFDPDSADPARPLRVLVP